MLKVILAGHTGLEKSVAACSLKRALEELHPKWGGDRIQTFDLEGSIKESGGGHVAYYAGATPTAAERDKWMKGWELVLSKIAKEGPYCALVTTHLVLASRGFRSYPVDFGAILDWGPDIVITLIDDVYSAKRRIELRDFHFSF